MVSARASDPPESTQASPFQSMAFNLLILKTHNLFFFFLIEVVTHHGIYSSNKLLSVQYSIVNNTVI